MRAVAQQHKGVGECIYNLSKVHPASQTLTDTERKKRVKEMND